MPCKQEEPVKYRRLKARRKAATKWYRDNPGYIQQPRQQPATPSATTPAIASLESVSASGGSQSFISTTLAEFFNESTSFDLLPNLQRRESNRIRQQEYQQQLTP
ncbi:23597_t:CDS:2 [Dentiscutata erythropus]|uniref:23597_t:CDS:1 n=1 Tax=Dentiscutata erythropus TaxID=1348616 RepID=A0A9N8VLS0_9GLOM|nr:23597_t:CDS:2 [Dentiscutata erythropus]